jgi:hypothetical protein
MQCQDEVASRGAVAIEPRAVRNGSRLKRIPQIRRYASEAALLSTTPCAADDAAIKQHDASTDHQAACAFLAKDNGNPAKPCMKVVQTASLKHDAENWTAVFGQDHAPAVSLLF